MGLRSGLKDIVYRAYWRVLRALAFRREVHGIHLLALVFGAENESVYFDKVDGALNLIARVSPARLARLQCAFDRVFVLGNRSAVAWYHPELRFCELSDWYVRHDNTTVVDVACSLIHEATHGMLLDRGVPYAPDTRARVERICTRAEIHFVASVSEPGATTVRLQKRLSWPDSAWSEEAQLRRELTEMRRLGVPGSVLSAIARRRGVRLEDGKESDWSG
jgi:hypothetical protein